MEIWKEIKGYEGHYQISNFGRIKSIKQTEDKILNNLKNGRGYLKIDLCKKGTRKFLFLHRLVAIHFISNPKNKPCINHKNGIKSDNKVQNLEWVTYSENMFHSYKNGLHKPGMNKRVDIYQLEASVKK